ncbi:DNA-binding domain-containing protein [Qipengyuania soli]|uniref:Putative DNA-binding domain-containing protein n=1 Tax=Qipengyuania soli TaxID=2782568 RepID=A0A7S8IUI2_9SPHN|nr:DNA-binding domain-containing protein [Qipengyuania soli]QPC99034.1 putative DNA-binding domain-containing protein [Qipengyuania soli]
MSTLAQLQEDFLGRILAEDDVADDRADGFAIYRNNYRSSLVEALRATFERTDRLVGADAFRTAAAHHCIVHPPSSWTLDLAGAGFPDTCADLFAKDPDVSELAALEWAMHCAFTAADAEPLDMAGFGAATASFGEGEWASLRLAFLPGTASTSASFDLVCLWSSLASDGSEPDLLSLDEPHSAIVWREGERPVFVLRPQWEGRALVAMLAGSSFSEACSLLAADLGEDAAVNEAGLMLARWLRDGLLASVLQ